MKATLLPDRGVVRVAGEDARKFLNGLLTADAGGVAPGQPLYAALLTPQGKIIVDMIVVQAEADDGGDFYLDCPRALAPTLVGAHDGLMHSPGQRANILRPQSGRLGIGVLDAGSHGLMVTQDFRN